LGARIGGFAAAYRARCVAPGAVVAIFLRHDPALHASYLAAMMSGLVPTFLPCPSPRQDPAIYWESLRHLLAHLDCGAFVLDRATLAELRAANLDLDERRIILLDDVPAAGAMPTRDIGEDAIALLQHSSGTTGRKKGVALRYRAVAAQLDAYGAALAIARDDVIVSWLPLYHDMGLVACFLLPAYAGVPFVQLDPFAWVARPAMFFAAIAAHRGTLAWLRTSPSRISPIWCATRRSICRRCAPLSIVRSRAGPIRWTGSRRASPPGACGPRRCKRVTRWRRRCSR
jgi:acyl-CoA synthetase (AMP-forming)/AMP-acid ligase II